MRKYLLLFTLLLLPWALHGQEDTLRLGYSVHGTVVDAVTGRPLEAVHVSIPDRHHATVTNADGQFTIKSDVPFSRVIFSHLGYRTYHQAAVAGDLRIRMLPESISLEEASIISGSPYEIVQAALDRVRENFSDHPELLECFYRETIRKRNRYTYISEAVSRIYKTAYTGGIFRDRTALEKSGKAIPWKWASPLTSATGCNSWSISAPDRSLVTGRGTAGRSISTGSGSPSPGSRCPWTCPT